MRCFRPVLQRVRQAGPPSNFSASPFPFGSGVWRRPCVLLSVCLVAAAAVVVERGHLNQRSLTASTNCQHSNRSCALQSSAHENSTKFKTNQKLGCSIPLVYSKALRVLLGPYKATATRLVICAVNCSARQQQSIVPPRLSDYSLSHTT